MSSQSAEKTEFILLSFDTYKEDCINFNKIIIPFLSSAYLKIQYIFMKALKRLNSKKDILFINRFF